MAQRVSQFAPCSHHVVHIRRNRVSWSKEEVALQLIGMHVNFQVGLTEFAVPVVGDVSSVHDLAEEIAQVIPRHLEHIAQYYRT